MYLSLYPPLYPSINTSFFLTYSKVNCQYLYTFPGELSKTINSKTSTPEVQRSTDSAIFQPPQVILMHSQVWERISQKKLSYAVVRSITKNLCDVEQQRCFSFFFFLLHLLLFFFFFWTNATCLSTVDWASLW